MDDRYMDVCVCLCRWMDAWMVDGWMQAWVDRWMMDRWVDN